jgi:hypothetical protein
MSSLTLLGDTSGSVVLDAPPVSGSTVLTLPTTTSTLAINGPAFSAYPSASQTVTTNVATKVVFDVEVFDTNNNFASSRFTPTVAGYYQINAGVQYLGSCTPYLQVYKNGAIYANTISVAMVNGILNTSNLIYCNGSTDYIEIYATSFGGTGLNNTQVATWFNGSMARGA